MNPDVHRILVVDDNSSVQEDFRRILVPAPAANTSSLDDMESELFGSDAAPARPLSRPECRFELQQALQGAAGLEQVCAALARCAPISVAFIDMRMPPGWNGVETAERIWGADPNVQIVICTAYSDYSWEEIVQRLGHTDRLLLLKKPFDHAEVWQLAMALSEKWKLTQAARQKLEETQKLAGELTHANQQLVQEVVDRSAAEAEMRRQAYFDALTGLPNRPYVVEYLTRCIARAQRNPDYRYAVLFMDLDNFKLINDSLGHAKGDSLLLEFAERISHSMRSPASQARVEAEVVSRLGGDEFIILLDGFRNTTDLAAIAEEVLSQANAPLKGDGESVRLSVSIGIAVGNAEYTSPGEILRDADTALYRAKSGGRSRFAIFDPDMHARARSRLTLENDIRRAVAEQHFSLVYQPIVASDTSRIVSVEALLRWDHPDYEKRSPALFVPVAEETGLIIPIGQWALEEGCRTLQRLRQAVPAAHRLRLNVNVSRRQLMDPSLPALVTRVMSQFEIDPASLGIEITESAVIDDLPTAVQRLGELKDRGVSLHLDDFGTGYSSLSCLHRFPLSVVKIDRSFVMTIEADPDYATIVHAIVTLAHSLRMRVTVEGVETLEQYERLRELGCDYVQGYYVARPMDAITLQRVLMQDRPLAPHFLEAPASP